MEKVIIGIVGKPDNTDSMWSYIEINNEISECIIKNNALTLGIIPQDLKFKKSGDNNYNLEEIEINDLESILSKVNGVVMQGGITSNSYEQQIIKICLKKDIPLLCICGGFNNLVLALGGSLIDEKLNIHNKYGSDYAHEIILKKDSKLYEMIGKETIQVNSIHQKVATKETVKNCILVGICPLDDTVEAIEVPNKKFAIGVKWHPEFMKEMNVIFEEFVKKCEAYYCEKEEY